MDIDTLLENLDLGEDQELEFKSAADGLPKSVWELDRIALALAHRFGEIRNKDIQEYKNEHPQTIGECLKRLVQKGWLQQSGRSRGTSYTLSNSPDSGQLSLLPSSEHSELDSEHSGLDSEHSGLDSEHSVSNLDDRLLFAIAEPIRSQGRSDPQLFRDIVLQLCSGRYLSLRELAKFLGRSSETVRTHYIAPLVLEGLLELRYPNQPKHSQQAYRTQAANPKSKIT
jgi:ATP-dependent DNA helicase RecG